jgi:hypothetical protein
MPSYHKTTASTASNCIFYIFETRVGPVGSTIEGVKIGVSTQEMYGRLRAYEQPGTQYIASAWEGPGMDISYLEKLFKNEFNAVNMKTQFETSATEVFIGYKSYFIEQIEELIKYRKLSIKFHLDNYHCVNKTQHVNFMSNYKPLNHISTNNDMVIEPVKKEFKIFDIYA